MKSKILSLVVFMLVLLIACSCDFTGGGTTNNIDITYNLNDGMTEEKLIESVKEGTKISLPTLTKEYYTFVGWSLNGKIVTEVVVSEAITLDAIFIDQTTFEIEYVLNGGVMTTSFNTNYDFGSTYTFPTPQKASYNFIGWFDYETDELVEGLDALTYGDIKIYAKWEYAEIVRTITYQLDGGILPENAKKEYTEGIQQALPTPKKEGYYFRGWFTNVELTSRISVITKTQVGDVTLYAKWEEKCMENAHIAILGDSISTFYSPESSVNSLYTGNNQFYYPRYATSITSVTQTWWYKAVHALNAILHVSNSYSGGTVTGTGESSANNSVRLSKLVQGGVAPDILIIWLGVNDCGGGVSTTNFKASYKTMLDKLETMYPEMQIFICNLPLTTLTNVEAGRGDFNKVIEEIGAEYNIPVIDFSKAWSSETEQVNNWTYLNDNVHPSALGMNVISQLVVKSIKEFYGIE